MRKFKSDFSIDTIGKFLFYSGILIGAGYGFLINYLFHIFIKVGFYTNQEYIGWIERGKYDKADFISIFDYSYFNESLISFVSLSLGFCITMYLWTSKPFSGSRRINRLNRAANVNTFFIFGFIMFGLVRCFEIYCSHGLLGDYFSLKKYFGYYAFIFPAFIYLYNRLFFSRIYRIKKLFFITTLSVIILGLIMPLL